MATTTSWKYKAGLLLIGIVVLIWVASAEVTQIIFSTYRHPFLLTWVGASFLSIYLPISWIKDAFRTWTTSKSSKVLPKETPRSKSAENVASPRLPPTISPRAGAGKDIEMQRITTGLLGEEHVESDSLLAKDHSNVVSPAITTRELIHMALFLAPMWLLTEYLSNASLSMTSVASTTILSSTSSLFTLLFGASLGQDTLNTPRVLSVLVSIVGVVMTELGKSTAHGGAIQLGAEKMPGETTGDNGLPGHSLIGDLLGLASAASYGFYTILLRKYAGGTEGAEGGPDMQKVFGYIGLVTLFGLWWIAFPLILLGWEPPLRLPRSYGLDEDIIGNALVGSVISDYFWALSVVWTTPLVATLGLSLTIPLAMVADMVMHGQSYSLVYILGSAQVFGGFLVANLADRFSCDSKQ